MGISMLACWALLASMLAVSLAEDRGWLIQCDNKEDAALLSGLAASGGPLDGSDYRLQLWWASFKKYYYKKYKSQTEEQRAYKAFVANMQKVHDINTNNRLPYWASGNFYADYDFATFRNTFLMRVNTSTLFQPRRGLSEATLEVTESEMAARRSLLATSVDWRARGKVTPVRDQGMCGSCWAYTATAVIESAYLITFKLQAKYAPINLSEQQLIDCATSARGYVSAGCVGGAADAAINYVRDVYQTQDYLYPYQGVQGSCGEKASMPLSTSLKLWKGASYPGNSEASLMKAVNVQPVIVYFTVAEDFYSYAGGIYVARVCSGAVNHALVVVGYYYTGNVADSYWIVKNSWSTWWGEAGYARIQMTGTTAGPCNMYTYITTAPLNAFRYKLGSSTQLPKPL